MNRAATGLPTPLHHAPQRLWLARAIAWALLLGGWLVLGTLGRQHLPQAAGGQAPVALWLTTVGGALALVGRWRWSAPALALLGRSAIALLLVAASFAVRACAA